jgi:hypothetical protein
MARKATGKDDIHGQEILPNGISSCFIVNMQAISQIGWSILLHVVDVEHAVLVANPSMRD